MLVKASIYKKDDPNTAISFLFNPAEFTVEKSNAFTESATPGLPASTLSFAKGGSRTLNMELFFDTYEKGEDVRTYTDKITGWEIKYPEEKGLMDIDSDTHAPPICVFKWGKYEFQCIIERVSKKFTMFLPEGTPVRATLSVSLKEYKELEMQLKEIARQSTDRTKVWKIKEGDSLWSIASKEYDDPDLWREIAEANKIDNPRLLTPGTDIIIPSLEK